MEINPHINDRIKIDPKLNSVKDIPKITAKPKQILERLCYFISKSENEFDVVTVNKYALEIGFYDEVDKVAKAKHEDPTKKKENANFLFEFTEHFKSKDEFFDHVALYTNEITKKNKDQVERVSILTMHSSKGLEFDYVFLPSWVDG